MIRILVKAVNTVENICLTGAVIAMLIIMITTNVDVVLRKLAGRALPGLYSITEDYLMVAMVFLSISYVFKKGGHVRVTLFLERFPKNFMSVVNKVMDILALGFFLSAAVINWQATMEAWEFNETTSSGLGYSLAPAIFLVCLGFAMTTLRICISFFNLDPPKS